MSIQMESPQRLVADGPRIERVVFFLLRGVVTATVVDYFETNLGPVFSISDSGGVDDSFACEHELEVIE